mgnify:CR=1 FL=1
MELGTGTRKNPPLQQTKASFGRLYGSRRIALDGLHGGSENVVMRAVLPLLLAAGLLACPLKCMGAGNALGTHTEDQGHVCGCCSTLQSPQETAPQSPVPVSPGDDCQCPTCFCHGAVLSAYDADLDGDAFTPDFLGAWAIEPLAVDPVTAAFTGSWSYSRHSTLVSECPPARILHQAFLL